VRLALVFRDRTDDGDHRVGVGIQPGQPGFGVADLGDLLGVAGMVGGGVQYPPGRNRSAIVATVSGWSSRRLW